MPSPNDDHSDEAPEERWRVFRRWSALIAVIDASGAFVWTNDAWTAHWRGRTEAGPGAPAGEFIRLVSASPDVAAALTDALRDALTQPDISRVDREWSTRAHEGVAEEWRVEIVREDDARPFAILMATPAKTAPAAPVTPAIDRAVFDQSPDGLLVVDRNGRIIDAGASLLDRLQCALDTIQGQPVDALKAAGAAIERGMGLDELRLGYSPRFTASLQVGGGPVIEAEISATAIDETRYLYVIRPRSTEAPVDVAELINRTSALLWTTDLELRITLALGGALDAMGTRPGAPVGLSLYEFLGTDDPDHPTIARHHRVLEGETLRYETRLDGREYDSTLQPLRDPSGNIVGCLGMALDITERKDVERELERSREHYRQLFKVNNAIKLLVDATGAVVDANDAASEFYGYSLADLLGMRLTDFVVNTPEELQRRVQLGLNRPRSTFVSTHRLANGETRQVEAHVSPVQIDDERLLFAIVHDVTDRIAAEEALRRSEERFRSIASNLPGVIYSFVLRPDGRRTPLYLSPGLSDLIGARGAAAAAEDLSSLVNRVHPDDLDAVSAASDEAMRAGRPFDREYRLRHDDGTYRWIRSVARPIAIGDDVLWQGLMLDVTPRKEAEDRLQLTELRLSTVFRQLPNVVLYETGGGREYISENVADLLGYEAHELVGDRSLFRRLVHPDDARAASRRIQLWREEGQNGTLKLEFRVQRRDGRYIWVEDHMVAVHPEGEAPYLSGLLIAITDRKQAEEALRQSEEGYRRLAITRERLLAELNHRVKNNLASLLSLVEMIESTAETPKEFADAIRDRIRAMNAIHNVLSEAGWTGVELRDLIRNLTDLFERGFEPPMQMLIDGPTLKVPPRQAGPLAIIIQELLTNWHKYAQPVGSGGVRISWELIEERSDAIIARLTWQELGNAQISAPQRHGLGLRLIQGFARFELGGNCEFRFDPPGLTCVIECALDRSPAGETG